ncbi:MAG: class I SAM-dependent methyltransferase [Planctomycetes bacterium]|nr:class I SAM-dependent methyltransferase [Planctomycetota bacterium]
MTDLSWSRLYERRREAAHRFGPVWRLPLRTTAEAVLREHLRPPARVLDVGAGARLWKDRIDKLFDAGVTYRSYDPDRETAQDYHALADVTERFDAALCFEVLEHLPPLEILGLLEQVRGLLAPGGLLFVTTPNVHHPSRWFGDCTHQTPLPHDDLAALLAQAGFETRALYRLHQEPWLWRLLRRYVAAPLHRYLAVDFAQGIAAVGHVPVCAVSPAFRSMPA